MLTKFALCTIATLIAGTALAGTARTADPAPKPGIEAKRGIALMPMLAKTSLRGTAAAKTGTPITLPKTPKAK